MKQLLLILAVLMGQPVLAADKKPLTKEESAKVIEKAIRKQLEKPTGKLTKADLEKVTKLYFNFNQLTDVKGLEKLTQLKTLTLAVNQLTDVMGSGEAHKVRVAVSQKTTPTSPRHRLLNCKRRCRSANSSATP